jgi:c-di-GMP-binding flagellar brake protein YcgR
MFIRKPAKEKRRFSRLAGHHLLKYKVVGNKEAQGSVAFVRNISAGGILFHSPKNLPAGSVIELEVLTSFSSSPEPVEVKMLGKVLRSRELKKLGGFDVAVEFIDLDENTKGLIDKKVLDAIKKMKETGAK